MTQVSLPAQAAGTTEQSMAGMGPGAAAAPHLHRFIFFLFILAYGISSSPAMAVEPVSGHYLSSYGKTIRLEYRVLYPPPVSLIIEQYFPSGLEIISAFPMPQIYNRSAGKMKWIFKHLQPGTYAITVEFNQPILSADIQATLRYRHPGSGLFTESTVLP
ncbi:hypothetical protein JWG42_02545 [Desulfoprunum benzoelyticum]|uniref:Uncharacterized protein n=1 Tax=Desulfoprunum benzoelyticum TaxID=1506996 RepID=A0A840UM89_9BACT|nr:hypothetical protein [Desulfoprunum benzoelyticum]MBB5346725.1 hypothetical protein [Desulfoprunum benzoelyticum]MBM9529033.1 hypothetical protein [Desulfoprunum benzoelyticum]